MWSHAVINVPYRFLIDLMSGLGHCDPRNGFNVTLEFSTALQDVPSDRTSIAQGLLKEIGSGLEELKVVVEKKQNNPVEVKKRQILNKIGDLEQLMVKEFPYE